MPTGSGGLSVSGDGDEELGDGTAEGLPPSTAAVVAKDNGPRSNSRIQAVFIFRSEYLQ